MIINKDYKIKRKKKKIEKREQLKVLSFAMEFPNQKIEKDVLITPFKIVFQTKDLLVEKYCFENFNELMTYHSMSSTDIRNMALMKRFLKKYFTKTKPVELTRVHKYIYEKLWMEPVKYDDKLSSIEFNEAICSIWSDPEMPYTTITGFIKINLLQLLEHYYKKKMIIVEYDTKFVSPEIFIRFRHSYPLMLTYLNLTTIKQYILNVYTVFFNTQNNYVIKDIVTKLKIKQIHTLKKQIEWSDDKSIKIYVNDFIKLLGIKVKKNIIPLTASGYLANKLVKSNSPVKKAIAAYGMYQLFKK